MELALKQRVVGASVLVVMAVIFVPMVLDGPATDSVLIVDLEIPQSGQDTQSRVLPLDLGESAEPQEPRTLPVPIPVDDNEPANEAVAPSGEASQPVSAAVEQPVDTTEAAPALPVPSNRDDPADAVLSGDWSFQVGSFSDQNRADRLIESLRSEGFPAYSEKASINGASRTRVRVGPFVTRGDAEAASSSLRQAFPDLNTTLLSDTSGGEAVEDTSVSTEGTAAPAWAIQVGSFSERGNADGLVARLQAAGFAAWSEQLRSDTSGIAWRVRVGPHLKREDANRERQQIEDALSIRGMVVSHP
ncbi:MAG: hypothetical protein DHS20C11_18690 [Lysobacteraceae bacterium]|nr:MAG: hypothetical protein DHS20C11_18690 [Xanthomonadaceae bacterium]